MESEALNVLVVVLEGARPDHLSCAGYEHETTPFVDQVAREGVRFTNAFTTAVSSPSAHASMLTGLYPSVHGATEEAPALRSSVQVLPDVLRAAGYRTAAFCPDPAISPVGGFGRGFDRFYTQRVGGRIAGPAADYARRASDRVLGRGDAGARRTTQALLDWVAAGRRPFCALVHFREALRPLRPPAPYDRMFMPGALTAPPVGAANRAGGGPVRSLAADEGLALVALHDGALRYLDLRLKQIADGLAAADRWDRTLVILTASYGENLGDHEPVGGPTGLRDERLRVPLIVRCPGCVPSGFVVEEFAQPVDLLPTIVALTGCGLEAPVQGRALLTAAGATLGPRTVFVETFRNPIAVAAPIPVRRKVIRTRREKLVWQSDEANALFDLVRDPQERYELAAVEPERADGLRRELFDWLAESERWAETRGLASGEGGAPALARRGAGE